LRVVAICVLVISGALMSGCNKNAEKAGRRAVEAYYQGDFGRARQRLEPLAQKTDENFALNNLRLGSTALVQYDLPEAERAFLNAYEVLNSFGVNDGGRTLGAVLVDEKLKIWRGEPYERAMANFYLGLIYYMQRDYDNARGAFENAMFKLRDYADTRDRRNDYREVESNFAAAMVMLGRTWQRLGREDQAKLNFDRLLEHRPTLRSIASVDVHANSNLLLVIDFGWGPRKVTESDGSIVAFSPPMRYAGRIPPPRVRLNGRELDTRGFDEPTFDLVAMAHDRKWQSIDTIRTVKSAVGTGLIAGGAGYGAYRASRDKFRGEDLAISAGMIATGFLLKASSQADTRQWEMLPRTTFLIPLSVAPGTYDLMVDFPMADGLRQEWRGIVVPETGEATYYLRMQRWNPGPFEWASTPQGRRAAR
jgi:tetratricopeptide (TPR) repeat protein